MPSAFDFPGENGPAGLGIRRAQSTRRLTCANVPKAENAGPWISSGGVSETLHRERSFVPLSDRARRAGEGDIGRQSIGGCQLGVFHLRGS